LAIEIYEGPKPKKKEIKHDNKAAHTEAHKAGEHAAHPAEAPAKEKKKKKPASDGKNQANQQKEGHSYEADWHDEAEFDAEGKKKEDGCVIG
jgi:hypothetical protein